MNHDRTYCPFSTCPHTYGMCALSCSAIATESYRPTAGAGEWPHFISHITTHC